MGIIGASLLTTYLLIMLSVVALLAPLLFFLGRSIREQDRTYQAVARSLDLAYGDVGNRWKGKLPSVTGHIDGIRVTSEFTRELSGRAGRADLPRYFNALVARPADIPCDLDMRASTMADRAVAFVGRQPIRFDDDLFDAAVVAKASNEQVFSEYMTEARRRAVRQIITQYPTCRITRKDIRLEEGGVMQQRDLEHVLRLMATTAKTLSGESGTARSLRVS